MEIWERMAEDFQRKGAQVMRFAPSVFLLVGCCSVAHAQPPQAVIESCLLGYSTAAGISVVMGASGHQVVEDVPGYRLTWPERLPGVRVGYAVSKGGDNDYVFVGRRRGYIRTAIPLSQWKPAPLEVPLRAGYGVVTQGTSRYVCVVESTGQGSAAFVMAGYIGRFAPAKGKGIQLYYAVADTKTFKGFKSD